MRIPVLLACLLFVPAVAGQTLFTDASGDGAGSTDLLRAELVPAEGRPDLVIEYEPGLVRDDVIEVTWDVIDIFGASAGRYGVSVDVVAEEFRLIKEGTPSEPLFALSGRIEDGSPSRAVVEGVPLEDGYRGIEMRDVRARVGAIVSADTALGGSVPFDFDIRYGVPVKVAGVQIGTELSGGPGPALVQLQDVDIDIGDDTVRWTGTYPPLDTGVFEDCGWWSGSVYIQDPHDQDWSTLVQIDWAVSARQGGATPAYMVSRPDPRGGLDAPSFQVLIDPQGAVQVVLEKGWWVGGDAVQDYRYRFISSCEGEETAFDYDPTRDFFAPAPGLAGVVLGLALLVGRRGQRW